MAGFLLPSNTPETFLAALVPSGVIFATSLVISYRNDIVLDFLTKVKWMSKVGGWWFGLKKRRSNERVNAYNEFVNFFMLEYGFQGLLMIAATQANLVPEYDQWWMKPLIVFGASLMSVFAQGTGFLSIAKFRNLANKLRPKKRGRNQLWADLYATGLSSLTVGGVTLALQMEANSLPVLIGVGAVGLWYWWKAKVASGLLGCNEVIAAHRETE